jgi:hypothetical protein
LQEDLSSDSVSNLSPRQSPDNKFILQNKLLSSQLSSQRLHKRNASKGQVDTKLEENKVRREENERQRMIVLKLKIAKWDIVRQRRIEMAEE